MLRDSGTHGNDPIANSHQDRTLLNSRKLFDMRDAAASMAPVIMCA
jgi:hypothetical protein